VRHTTHHPGLIESVQVLQNLPLPQELPDFQVLQFLRRPDDEQRIFSGKREDEGRVDREVVRRWIAGAAGAAVAVEGFLEEQAERRSCGSRPHWVAASPTGISR
jgi:hypothetical protein